LKTSPGLRQLYTPVQPTVKQSDDNVRYTEFLPDAALQDFICCYWELKTMTVLSAPFVYRVVADGCIDVFFELSNPEANFVMGFCKQFTEFPLGHSFHYIGVRFLPTMFPQLFRINAAELSNRFEELVNVAPSTSVFIAHHFCQHQTIGDIRSIFDAYFKALVSKTSFETDGRLYGAIEIILQRSGAVEIAKDLDTGISQRQLRRLFECYVGDTAKTFAKVVRFQHILRTAPSRQNLRENKLFFDSGYYDQAHFIKEFKGFYGVTPGKAFGE
jgi:AraC-like DNA-binding protein